MNKLLLIIAKVLKNSLPKKIYREIFAQYWYVNAPKTISYSQKAEDLMLDIYFSHRTSPGLYIDIGCFHPKWISNTYLLHKRGWSGVCFDLDQQKLNFMKKKRGKLVNCYQKAVVSHSTSEKRISYQLNTPWSDIDTLDEETALQNELCANVKYERIEVEVVGINDVLKQHQSIQLLNIDIEGLDSELILSIDFSKYRPEVIIFEDNENWGGNTEVRAKLVKFGYVHLFTSGGSIAYSIPK